MSGAQRPIHARYQIWGDPAEAAARAHALAVEQTHEFPTELAEVSTLEALGIVTDLTTTGPETTLATIAYPTPATGAELPQLLVMLFGNCSLLPGIRLVDLDVPDTFAAELDGPRFGMAGLRRLFDAPSRPLLATALKPMGLDPKQLADIAYQMAASGIDIIKDDQGLANQAWAPFEDRVRACAEAVQRANTETGGRTIYMPSLNVPAGDLEARIATAVDAGVGGFLVLPGITGFDSVGYAASTGLPMMAHPTFLGSFVTSPTSGIAHGVLFGPLMRLAGADATIFPNHGGRFSFSPLECEQIASACGSQLGGLEPIAPTPGGGMSLDRVPEMVEFYGRDVVLLIGGELHRGDLRRNGERFRQLINGV